MTLTRNKLNLDKKKKLKFYRFGLVVLGLVFALMSYQFTEIREYRDGSDVFASDIFSNVTDYAGPLLSLELDSTSYIGNMEIGDTFEFTVTSLAPEFLNYTDLVFIFDSSLVEFQEIVYDPSGLSLAYSLDSGTGNLNVVVAGFGISDFTAGQKLFNIRFLNKNIAQQGFQLSLDNSSIIGTPNLYQSTSPRISKIVVFPIGLGAQIDEEDEESQNENEEENTNTEETASETDGEGEVEIIFVPEEEDTDLFEEEPVSPEAIENELFTAEGFSDQVARPIQLTTSPNDRVVTPLTMVFLSLSIASFSSMFLLRRPRS